jgi:hypothetical protein
MKLKSWFTTSFFIFFASFFLSYPSFSVCSSSNLSLKDCIKEMKNEIDNLNSHIRELESVKTFINKQVVKVDSDGYVSLPGICNDRDRYFELDVFNADNSKTFKLTGYNNMVGHDPQGNSNKGYAPLRETSRFGKNLALQATNGYGSILIVGTNGKLSVGEEFTGICRMYK